MRLIDANKIRLPKGFFEKIDNVPKFYEWLDTLPTVDAEPVKHGMWINISISANEYEPSSAQCNLCGARVYNNFSSVISYCPKCGAKMKEVEE